MERINICTKDVEKSKELEELQAIFAALEEDRRHLQALLLQQKEEHDMQLSALERERIQERLEWEREMEALRSVLMTVAIGKGKLMSELRSHMDKQSLALRLRSAPVPAVKVEEPRKWWFCKKKASPEAALQGASTSRASTDAALQKIAKLEERIRKAEVKKQQNDAKKAAEAEKKAKKAEEKRVKKAQTETKKAKAN